VGKVERFIKYCDSNHHFVRLRHLHAYDIYYNIIDDDNKRIGSFFHSHDSFFIDINDSYASRHYYNPEIYFVWQLRWHIRKLWKKKK
jgi:hypothetical protein